MHEKLAFEEKVRRCTTIVCDDRNVLWLPAWIDKSTEHVRRQRNHEIGRIVTEDEKLAVDQLEQAFQNTNLFPRIYNEFVMLLDQGYEAPADHLLRQHGLHSIGRATHANGHAKLTDR